MIESKSFIPKSTDTDQKEAYREFALTQEEISQISGTAAPKSGVLPSGKQGA